MYIAVAWLFVSRAYLSRTDTLGTRQKCPLVGRDGWAVLNVIHIERLHSSPPAIFVLNTKACIVIITYAIVIEPKTNVS